MERSNYKKPGAAGQRPTRTWFKKSVAKKLVAKKSVAKKSVAVAIQLLENEITQLSTCHSG